MSWTCGRREKTGRGAPRSFGVWWPGAYRATWHHFRTVGVYSLSDPAALRGLGIGVLPYGPSPLGVSDVPNSVGQGSYSRRR